MRLFLLADCEPIFNCALSAAGATNAQVVRDLEGLMTTFLYVEAVVVECQYDGCIRKDGPSSRRCIRY